MTLLGDSSFALSLSSTSPGESVLGLSRLLFVYSTPATSLLVANVLFDYIVELPMMLRPKQVSNEGVISLVLVAFIILFAVLLL